MIERKCETQRDSQSEQRLTSAEQRALLRAAALGLLYPRRCPLCGAVLGFVPACEACTPEYQQLLLQHKRLAAATHYFGELSGAAAVFRYEGAVREAVLHMKYDGCRWYGPDLGNCMAHELFGCTFFQKYGILFPERAFAARLGYDVLVTVPKSNRRRGYNVPRLLAGPLARGLGLPVLDTALCRIRYTKHQAGLPLAERLANVAGAFAPGPDGGAVEGRRVLLVDDVITTGATAAACTAALLAAGAESVYAVGLASSQWQADRPAIEYTAQQAGKGV